MAAKGFINIVTVGDSKTGKTSLLSVFKNGYVQVSEVPGIFETCSHKMKVEGKKVELGLWDTSGDPEYEALRRLSYPKCDVFILCYAVNSRNSFENVKNKWLPEIRKYCPMVPIILVATKSDTRPKLSLTRNVSNGPPETAILNDPKPKPVPRFVNMDEGMGMAGQLGATIFLECSAQNNINVMAVFENAAKAALQDASNKKAEEKEKKKSAKIGMFGALKAKVM